MLTLYQTEWCPFSSAVREVLTELGVDFVARQVEPWPEQRAALVERSGKDEIPALETEDGQFLHGTRAIFGYLREREPWEHCEGHRRRLLQHRDARAVGGAGRRPRWAAPARPSPGRGGAREADAPGRLVEYCRASRGPEPEAEPTVVN